MTLCLNGRSLEIFQQDKLFERGLNCPK